jgi:hypothetical protein
MEKIRLITERFVKVGSKWKSVEVEENDVTMEMYTNCVNAKGFFKALGGYERHEKSYTSKGYIVTRIVSISPDRKNKSVFKYDFDRHFYNKEVTR